ncbi:MAG: YggS family pyridoxal phosphate-dependent enzyme [Flavisolibacter sp.]
MAINKENYSKISEELKNNNITLVAVSKTKPASDILDLYNLGHRDFGENYVQELQEKQEQLPKDIRWHFIGHLQSNKIKQIASFVHLIHGVDSFRLLREVNKQAQKVDRTINVLLQVHIAQEETKFGLDEKELDEIFNSSELWELKRVNILGLMGMASFTDDKEKVRNEFRYLKSLFDKYAQLQTTNYKLKTLSMGMSGDYRIAIEECSTMVRIGSLIFGERSHN